MVLIPWERDLPVVVADFLRKHGRDTTQEAFDALRVKGVSRVTSMSDLKLIAKVYSRKYRIPIRVSEEPFRDQPNADALYVYKGRKGVIYLHPILTYYPERYIVGAIEHEIEHHNIERKWEQIL